MASPLIYAGLRTTEAWLDTTLASLNALGSAPDGFIPGCFPSAGVAPGHPAIEKYKAIFEPENTPFKYGH